jgi:hypothetical protein
MKIQRSLLFFIPALLIWGCTDDSSTDAGQTNILGGKVVQFEQQDLNKSYGNCDNEGEQCAYVELTYPKVVSEQPNLAQMINDSIRQTLVNSLSMMNPGSERVTELEKLADAFIEDYKGFAQAVPDYALGWSVEADYEVMANTGQLLSFTQIISSFAGGAHPNTFLIIHNFDLKNNTSLSWGDILKNFEGLKQVVEKEFKVARGLPESTILQDEGFFMEGDFYLPSSFGFNEEGLYLFYNAYEAAAYALGPTELTIPYDQLNGLIDLERIGM